MLLAIVIVFYFWQKLDNRVTYFLKSLLAADNIFESLPSKAGDYIPLRRQTHSICFKCKLRRQKPMFAINLKIKAEVRGNKCLFVIKEDSHSGSSISGRNPETVQITGEGKFFL